MRTLTVQRDVDAVLIPSGMPIVIPAGTVVRIAQTQGGFVTVEVGGNLARIEGKDADALGLSPEELAPEAEKANAPPPENEQELAERVWAALKTCYDPEIPVDIVNLGLVYEMRTERIHEGENKWRVRVVMTLTAPGCPVAPMIVEDVRSKLLAIPGVEEAEVELTFDPPWDRSRMSDEARLKLGLF